MKVASFFSGIGGFELAFENVGMETVFQCEINSFSQKVLKKHWPDVRLWDDINTLTHEGIPEADLWCGGFPCQDLSSANQGKRKGLNGKRSGLFYKFAELASHHKPKWIVLENVPGLLNSHQGDDFKILIEEMDELGYGVSWRVLDAKYFGTPQRRRRTYIVASLGNLSSAEVLFEPEGVRVAAKQGEGERQNTATRNGKGLSKANIYSIQHAGIGRKPSAGPQAKGYRNDGETYTLDSRGAADAVCSPHDAFRVREASGISGGLDGNRYRALGNAVCVPVVQWIGRRIMYVENRTSDQNGKLKVVA
jgi:DNA (cytosine-5)-methyltransferase 1